MKKFVVLLGPPGAGKGTQAKLLSDQLGLAHISSGDLFRENIKGNTSLGQQAKSYMEKGELVPDSLTISMVRDRIQRPDCQNGCLLDGFPRTSEQAAALEAMLAESDEHLSSVPYIAVPDAVLVERLSGRLTCPVCGSVYHTRFNPPKVEGICDKDGAELVMRNDDKPETVQNRIDVYNRQTMPLIDFFRQEGILFEVDGTQDIDLVTADLLKAIG